MISEKVQWLIVLAVSVIILLLRLIDFVPEAINTSFQMTRFGVGLFGVDAFMVQLGIILVTLVLIRYASIKLDFQPVRISSGIISSAQASTYSP